jgi:hypothetical protein
MRSANLALKFILELVAIAGFAYWGARTGGSVAADVALGIVAPLVAVALWSRFAAPRAPRRLPTRPRVVLELAILLLGAVGFLVAGALAVGIAAAAAVVANAALLEAFDQWEA